MPPITPEYTSAVPRFIRPPRETTVLTWTLLLREGCRLERQCSGTWKAWASGSYLRHARAGNEPMSRIYSTTPRRNVLTPRPRESGVYRLPNCARLAGHAGGLVPFPRHQQLS